MSDKTHTLTHTHTQAKDRVHPGQAAGLSGQQNHSFICSTHLFLNCHINEKSGFHNQDWGLEKPYL